MFRTFLSLFAAGVFSLGIALPAAAVNLDGEWRGSGDPQTAGCVSFEIVVSVSGNKVAGKALHAERDLTIDGHISEDGRLSGEVEYGWFTVGELIGWIDDAEARGYWRSIKGPDCAGTFSVRKL